ncbi:MAG: L,D-transpeptidase [Caldilineaceae bacterium]
MAQEGEDEPSLLEILHAARAAEQTDADAVDAAEPAAVESAPITDETDALSALPPVPIELPRMAPPLPKLPPAPAPAANTAAPGQNATPQGAYSPGFITPAEEVKSFLRFPDDIEQRTTAFDPSGVELPEGFVMPDIEPGERWIRVDLGHQRVYAYEGDKAVRGFVISSGLPGTPTVTGEFRVITKVADQVMSGGGSGPGTPGYYYLPHVKWVMYFYSEYALHGSYWHANFGNPMSHGCVNMTNADAKWLFDWAGPKWDGETEWFRSTEENPGTRVVVHQ